MEALDLETVVQQVGGRWVGRSAQPRVRIAEIGTDTRRLSGEGLFVALRGEHRDGHSYVCEARRRGVVASIVSERLLPRLPEEGGPFIAVDDPLAALERLAKWNRDHLDLTVVGVTGSVGKTSTKEFLGTLLGARYRTKTAPRSFNNRLGVALTLLTASPRDEVLVVELATSAPGELSHLAGVTRPGRVVITEIAPAHLEGLRDLDGVVDAKAEVLDGFPEDGQLFLREGIYGFDRFARKARRPALSFGWGRGDYAVTDCRRIALCGEEAGATTAMAYGYHFTVNHQENFILPVAGRHNVLNALAAMCVARDLGIPWEEIRAALALCRLPPLRLQVVRAGEILLFDDSYNANPRSMEAAIEEWLSFSGQTSVRRNGSDSRVRGTTDEEAPRGNGNGCGSSESRHLVAVLGDMLELGDASRSLHRQLGERIASTGARLLVTVGSESRWIRDGFEPSASDAETVHFGSAGEALPLLKSRLLPGDRVLFKGSRRIGLDRVVQELARWFEGQAGNGLENGRREAR